MKNIYLISLLFCLFTSCQTIHIHNGNEITKNYTQDEWHHIGIFELAEFSGPVDLNDRCSGKEWSSVRTRRSVGQVFLGLVPYLSNAWSPLEVSIACK